nr:hypothetical protein BaRGS_013207 [Batillaria attramentaria]
MPVYVRCNGVNDCPGHEDEVECDSYTCPGFYRCRASRVCLHPDHVCDGIYQCPQHDDELLCDVICPASCTCHGLAFTCTHTFQVQGFPQLRYLDASGSGISLTHLGRNSMLVFLSLADCNVTHLAGLTFPNLHHLDLVDNSLDIISVTLLTDVPSLQVLRLAGNPLTSVFVGDNKELPLFLNLRELDLSRVKLKVFNARQFRYFPNLTTLNLSDANVELVQDPGFQSLPHLNVLDVRGCPMTQFPRDVFQGLEILQAVHADNYKLCCPATLPADFNPNNCHAPFDEVSSCEALLRSDLYRAFLSLFCSLALVGNLGCFVFRVLVLKSGGKSGFGVFVSSLCLADFLMGVYLAVIGVADRVYQGTYLWQDLTWRQSVACKIAGFLSLLSSEVSAILICIITIDRFLVLRFPFSHVHFGRRSALLACVVAWSFGLVLAAVPLLPVTSHWSLYGQTGICIPLPVTRGGNSPGHDYAFGVIIVLNFVLFIVIGAGQASVYVAITTNAMTTTDTSRRSQEVMIARRLITIVMSDFLCWFPIGLLGLLAAQGTPIPGEVGVGVAIFVLPLNSALNPFLYTINVMLERRRKRQEAVLLTSLLSQKTKNEIPLKITERDT